MTAPTLFHLLADNLPQRADKIALIDAARSITYAGLASEAARVAGWLHAAGVRPGDRVIVHLRKGIDEVAAMFGAWQIGAVVVNVNTQWTLRQLAYVAQDSGAGTAILAAPVARALQAELPGLALLVQGNGELPPGATAWTSLPEQPAPVAEPPRDALAMIIYTSGSTGLPKGVMLSHANICIGAESVIAYLGLAEDDRLLSVLPYSFDAGLNQLTTALRVGATVVHQPVSMPAEIIRMAREQGVTTIAGVPPIWNQIIRYLADARLPLPALRRITNTGGKIPPNILEQMPNLLPDVDIYLMYGLTEAFRSTYLPPARFAAKMGSIGQAIPNAAVHVIKHGIGIAGPGEQGELVHGGPLVSLGYWQQPDLTAQRIRPCPELADLLGDAPVVYSGDLVRVDADGDLWFIGRMDDMIKTQGFRLSPTEVEDAISRTGLVGDVVAFAVDDADHGQVVQVAAVALDGAEAGAILAQCRRHMAHYMVPRAIHLWPGAMPRTASGKIDRPQVIATARAALAPSADPTA